MNGATTKNGPAVTGPNVEAPGLHESSEPQCSTDQPTCGSPQPWKPQEGDTLTGEILRIGLKESRFGGVYPVLDIRRDDGECVAVHAFRSVLKNELAMLRPQVGARVSVTYLGIRTGNSQQSYHAYRASSDEPGQSFDWGQYGEQGGDA